jgi:serine/threonine protein kinase
MSATRPTMGPPVAESNPATEQVSRASDSTDGTDPAAADRKRLGEGDILAQYTIRKRLGRGGMGAVYLAWDGRLRRHVALKVLHPKLVGNDECRERFLREARAVAAIAHDNVVTVYEVGVDQDIPFITMQHLQGQSLDHYLEKHGLPVIEQVLRIGREAAAGLGAAHALGIVHRDIKPANLWLEAPNGRVKVLDFGLAKPTSDGTASLTQPGLVVGTPLYMAPEQARGKPVDSRADLFSLGAVLYELCVGRSPFAGENTMAVFTALAADTPQRVVEANPRVPAALSELIAQLLEKNPAARPSTTCEVIERLAAIEASLAVPPLAVSPAAATPPAFPRPPSTPPTERADTEIEPVDDTPTEPMGKRRFRRGKRGSNLSLLLAAVAAIMVAGLLVGLGVVVALKDGVPSGPGAAATTAGAILAGAPSEGEGAAAQPPANPGRKPVKVFLLAGQSNMAGRGQVRTLDWLGKDPKYGGLLGKIKNADGSWVVRDDVWVFSHNKNELKDPPAVKRGNLTVGFGTDAQKIGPELMFGHVMGDHFDNQVLLVKVTLGGMSLAVEGRPPSSGGDIGPHYGIMRNVLREVLANVARYFPAYDGCGLELAGFVWFQGFNDSINPIFADQYERNLVNLIKDVRRDLGLPKLPVVIGEMGMGGESPDPGVITIRAAQAAAVGRPEFAGNVALAKTADVWDAEAEALLKQGWDPVARKWKTKELLDKFNTMANEEQYHYMGSGKIMALVGYRLGEAMKPLLGP